MCPSCRDVPGRTSVLSVCLLLGVVLLVTRSVYVPSNRLVFQKSYV